MYIAPLVIAVIAFCRLYRWACMCWAGPLPVLLQWFSLQYFFLGLLMLDTFRTAYEVLSPAGWLLDPSAVRAAAGFHPDPYEVLSPAVRAAAEQWEQETLSNFGPLIVFSLTLPLWVIGAFVVSILHTRLHVKEALAHGTENLTADTKRDNTIFVVSLPAIYAVMGFRAVVHVWQVVVNQPLGLHTTHTWEFRKEMYNEMYESCFLCADVYEAMSLYIFAELAVSIIEEKVHAQSESAQRESSGKATQDLCKTGHDLAHSLHGITVIGIRYFCISCICQALYYSITISLKYFEYEPLITAEQHTMMGNIFIGMGTLGSFAAIENIIVVEHAFGGTLLSAFSPAKKFWSAKVLVSLSFFQEGLLKLPPFSHWSGVQQKLLFSSLITFECFAIALFHLVAWGHSEPWYSKRRPAVGSHASEPLGKRQKRD